MKRGIGFALVVWMGISIASEGHATFHLMQIEQVVGGVKGVTSAQAIQLRMRSIGQEFVSLSRLRAWDASGANPVLLIDFSSDVVSGGADVRVLVVSPDMTTMTSPPVVADFTMTNPIPAAYLSGGSITFEGDDGIVYWRLSWGTYSGDNSGSTINDPNGDFGPPFGEALPSWDQGLLFQGAATDLSADNETDYALTASQPVLTNNAGDTFAIDLPTDVTPRTLVAPLTSRPNPFNPTTEISFTLARAGLTRVSVYDVAGRRVTTLLDDRLAAGRHQVSWNGSDASGRELASGAYFVQLLTADRTETRKLILLK